MGLEHGQAAAVRPAVGRIGAVEHHVVLHAATRPEVLIEDLFAADSVGDGQTQVPVPKRLAAVVGRQEPDRGGLQTYYPPPLIAELDHVFRPHSVYQMDLAFEEQVDRLERFQPVEDDLPDAGPSGRAIVGIGHQSQDIRIVVGRVQVGPGSHGIAAESLQFLLQLPPVGKLRMRQHAEVHQGQRLPVVAIEFHQRNTRIVVGGVLHPRE